MLLMNRNNVYVDNLEVLINPRTPEQWQMAINTDGTPANKFINDIINSNIEFENMLIEFTERCIQYSRQENKKQLDELHKKQIQREKREEKEQREIAIREMKEALKKQAEQMPKTGLSESGQLAAVVAYQLDALKAENIAIKEKIQKIDETMDSVSAQWAEQHKEKVKEFTQALKEIAIYDANNKKVELNEAQSAELAAQLAEAALGSPERYAKSLKVNPGRAKYIEEQKQEQEKAREQGKELKAKDVDETTNDQRNFTGELSLMFFLANYFNDLMDPLQIKKIINNNHELGSSYKEICQKYKSKDIEKVKKLNTSGAERAEEQEKLDLNTEKTKVCEQAIQVLTEKINEILLKKHP